MPKTLRANTGESNSRRHVLDCAARVFRENGYAAASLRDIANAAGIQTASLYSHFSSKDEIVAEVLNRAVQTVFEEVRKSVDAVDSSSPLDRIEAAVAGHLRAVFETDDYNGASIRIFAQLPPHIGEMTHELREEYVLYWRNLLQEARREKIFRNVDLTMLRLVLFGAMNWAPQWYKPGEYSLPMIARIMCDLVFNGAVDKQRDTTATRRRPRM